MDLLVSLYSDQYQHCYTLETLQLLETVGLNAFNHPWNFQVNYTFPLPALVPFALYMFLAEQMTWSTPMFNSSHTMLDGGFLAQNSPGHVGRTFLIGVPR